MVAFFHILHNFEPSKTGRQIETIIKLLFMFSLKAKFKKKARG